LVTAILRALSIAMQSWCKTGVTHVFHQLFQKVNWCFHRENTCYKSFSPVVHFLFQKKIDWCFCCENTCLHLLCTFLFQNNNWCFVVKTRVYTSFIPVVRFFQKVDWCFCCENT